jgi:N-acetyl-D-muramate 6-phosphate phosphatase
VAVVSVIFDVGETLLDDSREFGAWADWIGVPRHTFSAVLGAVTAAGRDNAETFQYFRPGFDLATEREQREKAGAGENYCEADLYPDVRPALAALRKMGLWVGIAGNQACSSTQGPTPTGEQTALPTAARTRSCGSRLTVTVAVRIL